MADAGVGEAILISELAFDAGAGGGAALGTMGGLGAAAGAGATAAETAAVAAPVIAGGTEAGVGAGALGGAGLYAPGAITSGELAGGAAGTSAFGTGMGAGTGAGGTGITGLGGAGYGGGLSLAGTPGFGGSTTGLASAYGAALPTTAMPNAGAFTGLANTGAPLWGNVGGAAVGDVGGFAPEVAPEIVKDTTSTVGQGITKDTAAEVGKNAGKKLAEEGFLSKYGAPLGIAGATTGLGYLLKQDQNRYGKPSADTYSGPLSYFKYDPKKYTPQYATPSVYQVPVGYADGGIASLNPNAMPNIAGRSDTMFPQSQQDKTQYATPSQLPTSAQVLASDYDQRTNPYTGAESPIGMARGGIASLGSYSDGGQMLRGPGDGVSDSIPASIGGKQPARLAEGEFVVPARAVSELGNGSTDAGAKQLYAMLGRIENKRKRGKGLAYQANPKKMMPV